MQGRAILAAMAVAAAGAAQSQEAETGRDLFETYCTQCHGADATGGGPMAEMLAIDPPDLTGLAARNDGVFPMAEVARQIDGRARVLAHGGDMPVFGPALDSDRSVALRLPSGQTMMAAQPLASLLAYLVSIQAE